MSRNKIVDYYTPNDERLEEYYEDHSKMLGLNKQPYGIDEHGTLRFEGKDSDSKVWKRYKELGGSEDVTGDLNTLAIEFQQNKFSIDEMMQFYRELGYSLCGFVDIWAEKFYAVQDSKEFQAAIDKLKDVENFEEAKRDILDSIFLANLDGVGDELILKYRIAAKKIVDENFGAGAWTLFVNSIRNKNEKNSSN